MRAGGIDLGVVEVLREPVPEAFDAAVLAKGARDARAHYKTMFRDVDAAIMMPGANTSHPAYLAMQDWLNDDLREHRGRRTIHFHWIENGSAYPIAGQPLPPRPAMDEVYQRALLQTDYAALAAVERKFASALGDGEVRITSPSGTDLRIGVGFNPLLAVPDRQPWIPYYGYGAGVVRLSLGDNAELGGAVRGGYVRWNFFTDLTITVGGATWVREGKLEIRN